MERFLLAGGQWDG